MRLRPPRRFSPNRRRLGSSETSVWARPGLEESAKRLRADLSSVQTASAEQKTESQVRERESLAPSDGQAVPGLVGGGDAKQRAHQILVVRPLGGPAQDYQENESVEGPPVRTSVRPKPPTQVSTGR